METMINLKVFVNHKILGDVWSPCAPFNSGCVGQTSTPVVVLSFVSSTPVNFQVLRANSGVDNSEKHI